MNKKTEELSSKVIDDILEHLRKIKYLGMFPLGIEVLLVSLSSALDEAKVIEPKITNSILTKVLLKDGVFIFNSPEDWLKYKDPEYYAKRRRKK